MKYETDRLEQYSGLESIRIAGLPKTDDESETAIRKRIVELGKECGTDLEECDISVCHRAGFKNAAATRPKAVLCRFVSRAKKSALMQNRKHLKGKDGYDRVFVNDDMTQLRARMFMMLKRNPSVQRVSTINGRIHCRPNNNPDRVVVVDTPDDLFKVGYTSLPYQELGLQDFRCLPEQAA